MKTKYVIIGGAVLAAAVGGYLYYDKVISLKNGLVYKFKKVRVALPKTGRNEDDNLEMYLPVTLTMSLQNTVDTPITVTAFDGAITFEGNEKKGSAEMVLQFNIVGSAAITYFTDIVKSRSKLQVPFVTKGFLKTSLGDTPVRMNFYPLDFV
jgi:hypothetical protein